ncbi:MAG: sigma-54-dependent transcriptional regulator [Oligoflexales bacterium]
MSNSENLADAEWNFLTAVANAAFANPFGEDRARLDNDLVGDNRFDEFLKKLSLTLDKAGSAKTLSERQRKIYETSHLFSVFHTFTTQFDTHVEQQLQNSNECLTLPFGDHLADALRGVLKSESKVNHFVSIFFQLRRAFYFIGRALPGNCPSMQNLRKDLWDVLFTSDPIRYERFLIGRMEDFSLLFVGETGSGKSSAASAVGRSGYISFDAKQKCFVENFNKIFMHVNLSQYNETLIESELFGHRKGSFTGAIENKEGILSQSSSCGHIFLDEIGDISLPIQVKLLNVLQERKFSPIGGHNEKKFRGRVLAATNKSIDTLINQGKLRKDFYYRLCTTTITLPSLRQRICENTDELKTLVNHIVARVVGEDSEEYSDLVLRNLQGPWVRTYPWPGNVRELEQYVRRIILNGNLVLGQTPPSELEDFLRSPCSAEELVSWYCKKLFAQHKEYTRVAEITKLDRRTVKRYISSI